MTRKSKREIERALDELASGTAQGGRPEPLTTEAKRALDDLFDVGPVRGEVSLEDIDDVGDE